MTGDARRAPERGARESIARGLIPDWLDERFTRSVVPVIRRLVIARVNPNAITVAAFLLTAAGAACIALGHFLAAFTLIVAGGILDFSDGKVAALTGRVSAFGGILDSTLDRYSDTAVYLGLTLYYAGRGFPLTALAAVLALAGSMMTSYLMALGKAHGFSFRVGVLRRQDRVTLVATGLLFGFAHATLARWLTAAVGAMGITLSAVPTLPLALVVWLLAALTNVTALQRLARLRRLARAGATGLAAEESLRERQLRTLRAAIGPALGDGTGGANG